MTAQTNVGNANKEQNSANHKTCDSNNFRVVVKNIMQSSVTGLAWLSLINVPKAVQQIFICHLWAPV
jgi:hypothetical protein